MGIYELGTVSYGTASAPYLATCCLQLLVEYDSKDFRRHHNH